MTDGTVQTVASLCSALREVPVAVMSDVMAAAGLPNRIISSALQPLLVPTRFAGPARCFSGRPGISAAADPELVYEADRVIHPGDVVVLDTGGFTTGSVIGGNTAAGWLRQGCVGIVTNGLCRDIDDLDGMKGVFALGVTPLSSQGGWHYASLNEPVNLPGQTCERVTVSPGDIIHADRDGVAVIPSACATQLLEDAIVALESERRIRQAIGAGEDRGTAYRANPRFAHVRRVLAGE